MEEPIQTPIPTSSKPEPPVSALPPTQPLQTSKPEPSVDTAVSTVQPLPVDTLKEIPASPQPISTTLLGSDQARTSQSSTLLGPDQTQTIVASQTTTIAPTDNSMPTDQAFQPVTPAKDVTDSSSPRAATITSITDILSRRQTEEKLQTTTEAADFSSETTNSRAAKPATPPESPKVIKSSLPTPPASPRANQNRLFARLNSNPEPETKPTPETKGSTNSKNDSHEKGEPAKSNHNSTHASNHIESQSDTNASSPSNKGKASAHERKNNDKEISLLTLAGQNTGASMEFGAHNRHREHQERKKTHHENEHSRKDANSGEVKASNSTPNTKPIFSLVNSNVQSVNNSVLLNSSCNQRDPGVHVKIVRGRRKAKVESK